MNVIMHVVFFCEFKLPSTRDTAKERKVLNNGAGNQTDGNFSKYATVRVKLRTHMLIRMPASDV